MNELQASKIKNNKLIAAFMGYNIINYKGKLMYDGNKFAKTIGEQTELWNGLKLEFTGRYVDDVDYPFDTNFNYLIPIIRKIEESGYVVAIKGISYQIYKVMEEDKPMIGLVCGDLRKKTELTYLLITDFLEYLTNK